jgi:hypothetical protein
MRGAAAREGASCADEKITYTAIGVKHSGRRQGVQLNTHGNRRLYMTAPKRNGRMGPASWGGSSDESAAHNVSALGPIPDKGERPAQAARVAIDPKADIGCPRQR